MPNVESKGLSPLTKNAITYAWRQLAQRVGIPFENHPGTGFEEVGLSVYYDRPDQINPVSPAIVVVPCEAESWSGLLELSPNSLKWLSPDQVWPLDYKFQPGNDMPILFWGSGYKNSQKPFAEMVDHQQTIVFYADIIAATFFMLSRWEETVVPERDLYDRFPARASVACKQGFLDRPLIDEYALVLKAWLKMILPRWEPNCTRFKVKLSHDIDRIQAPKGLYNTIHMLGGDLIKRRSLPDFWLNSTNAFWRMVAPENSSEYQAIYRLASISREAGVDSAFYFKARVPGEIEYNYDLQSPLLQNCLADLREQAFEIGFHPGQGTYNNFEQFLKEKQRLDRAVGEPVYGGRQHQLRFQVPLTWQYWEQAGLTYDSTLGYGDHEGFRCGTCYAYTPFDLERDNEFDLLEIPLIMMDVTLQKYRKLTPEEAEIRILTLAEKCKEVGGIFTLLWHNANLDGMWRKWGEMYRRVVTVLGKMQRE